MKQDVGERLEISQLEWWRRAQTGGEPEAWAAFQHGLEETVLSWFHDHPCREAACRLPSERYFVARAFERLRQAVSQRQVICETLGEVVLYLRASLFGVIMAARAGLPSAGCDEDEHTVRPSILNRVRRGGDADIKRERLVSDNSRGDRNRVNVETCHSWVSLSLVLRACLVDFPVQHEMHASIARLSELNLF